MKKFIVLVSIAIAISLCSVGFGQVAALPNDPITYAVSIEAGAAVSKGTGFYLTSSNGTYLVTAKHVLVNPNAPLSNIAFWDSAVDCKSYLDSSNMTELSLDLRQLETNNLIRFSTQNDIIVVKIEVPAGGGEQTVPGTIFRSTNRIVYQIPTSLARTYNNVSVGSDIFLFGYPSSVGLQESPQFDQTLPLVRKGIIAGKNPQKRTLIIDCPSYPGNSGGPIILKEQLGLNTWNTYVVGVVKEFVPFREVWLNTNFKFANQTWSNSGYSVVEPMDEILNILW